METKNQLSEPGTSIKISESPSRGPVEPVLFGEGGVGKRKGTQASQWEVYTSIPKREQLSMDRRKRSPRSVAREKREPNRNQGKRIQITGIPDRWRSFFRAAVKGPSRDARDWR